MEGKPAVVSVEGNDYPIFLPRAPDYVVVGDSRRILRYRRDILSEIPKCPNAGQRNILVRK